MTLKISSKRFQSIQKGSVLILALALVAMIEVILMGIVLEHRISVRHTTNYLDSIEAIQLILGAEEQAKTIALELYRNEKPFIEKSTLVANTNTSAVHTLLWDAQGFYNINLITEENGIDNTSRFLSLLIPNNEEIKNKILDYIFKTKYLDPQTDNSSNIKPFISISELRGIPELDPKLYQLLDKNIATLPTEVPLNVNQATELALTTLAPEITTDTARSLIALRNSMEGFATIEAFTSLPPLQDIDIDEDAISVKSTYYWVTSEVELNNIQMNVFSLIKIKDENNKLNAQIVYRSFGGK